MAGIQRAVYFLVQSIVIGLAAAFLIVLVRPELMPVSGGPEAAGVPAPGGYADAVARSAPAVVNVYTTRLVRDGARPEERRPERFRLDSSLGSAVIIDSEGYLVTNYHVVAGAVQIRVQLADGRVADPVPVGQDLETDLALLKIDLPDLPAVPLGRSDRLRIGDVVLAIGNPYGLSQTVTQGIVSATGRGLLGLTTFENFIQTDAAINTGNSGGALVNTRGELVGINTAVLAQDIATEGISFAIPVNLVRGVVRELKEHGRVIRGWLGMEPDDLTPAELAALGLESTGGILLERVHENSPASRAGLRRGDVLVAIDGAPIGNTQQALLRVAGVKPGTRLAITGIRDGERFETEAVVGERPQFRPASSSPPPPSAESSR
ncbi:S1C family serine protease [Lentisalinibacter sediminis]|uniref:S1C family serine protease n=1 Tax=Lentisalinibacter sediminis TaxID=2992237 RepID=UPI003868FFE8